MGNKYDTKDLSVDLNSSSTNPLAFASFDVAPGVACVKKRLKDTPTAIYA